MKKIVFDIETIGESFFDMDKTTKDLFIRRACKEGISEEKINESIKEQEENFALSPLTGQIAAIGILDADLMKGFVFFQSLGADMPEIEENNIKFISMSEKDMLSRFWEISQNAEEFIGFNSRGFDAPFIITRSAANNILPSVDLMSDRYGRFGIKHIDLYDQLSFYGATRFTNSGLHMWCRALGIKSPKDEEICGSDVSNLFKEKKFMEIARYNARDIIATKELYGKWIRYFRFS